MQMHVDTVGLGLHELTKQLLNMHVTRASRAQHDHANQQSSSTGLPIGLQANIQPVIRAPRARNGLATQFFEQCDKLNAMQCLTYTGSTGSTGLPKTCVLHGLHGLKTHFNSIHQYTTLCLP